MSDAPKRPRMIFDCPERLRRAIHIYAGEEGVPPSDAICSILVEKLGPQLEQADKAIARGAKPSRAKRQEKPKD